MILVEFILFLLVGMLLLSILEQEYIERHVWADRQVVRDRAWEAIEELEYVTYHP